MSLPGTGLSLLSNNAIAMIAAASQYPFKDQPEPYMEFIERYGTHYMTSAIYGGSINCDSFFNNYSSQYTEYKMSTIFGSFLIIIEIKKVTINLILG